MIKKAFKFIFFIIALVFMSYSTHGWQSAKANVSVYTKENKEIAENMERHVNALSREGEWRSVDRFNNLQAAAKYIGDYLGGLGYEVEGQYFSAQGKIVSNVIAQKKGIKDPKNIIIVGANYDSYFTPGADNNASGIAALLELANAFSKLETNETIRFVAFANAEPPFLGTEEMGSVAYLKQLKESKDSVESVFILSSIGYYSTKSSSQRYPPFLGPFYPEEGSFIALVGNIDSYTLLRAIVPIFKKDISLPVRSFVGFDFINSDHGTFWKEKYKTILITDTGSYRNPNFYSLSDMPGTLNYLNMAQIVQGLVSVLKNLSD